MRNSYARIINSSLLVEDFVDNVLKIKEPEKEEAINLILAAEKNMKDDDTVPTLTHVDNRHYLWRSQEKRESLREQICNELITKVRLNNDDNIKLGEGGCLPVTVLQKNKEAYYIMGAPASGKSSIASKIADLSGAYILDSDYAKRKLPEYTGQIGAASLIHEESDALVFNYKGKSLFEYCLDNGYNMVIPKVGSNIKKVEGFCEGLNKAGYKVHLILVDLDREKATKRAYYRFKETKRYVPLSVIFDVYANEPTLNYYKIKSKNSNVFLGFAAISTDVEKGKQPLLYENSGILLLNKLFKEGC